MHIDQLGDDQRAKRLARIMELFNIVWGDDGLRSRLIEQKFAKTNEY